MKQENIKKLTVVALLSAVAFVLMALEFPVPLVPWFIKMDVSEFPALITAFILGPLEGIAVCFIKNLLHLSMTYSAGMGELANIFIGAAFVGTAGLIYKKKGGICGSVLGCLAGSLAMAAVSYPINLFIVYPVYSKMMPVDEIIGLYKKILPSVGSLESALLIFNVPFTFVKGLLVSALSLATYKQLAHLYNYKIRHDC